MQEKKREHSLAKAILLSAGVLALPMGVAHAETADLPVAQSEVDMQYDVGRFVDDVVETTQDASNEEAGTAQGNAAKTAQENAAETEQKQTEEESATSAAEQGKEKEFAAAAQEALKQKQPLFAEGIGDVIEIVEETQQENETEKENSEQNAEKQENESSDVAVTAKSAERKEAVGTKYISRIAPPDTCRTAHLVEGQFYDTDNQPILNRWVEHQNQFYFVNSRGYCYTRRFISFGGNSIYYLNGQGQQMTGVLTLGEKKYLLDEKTGILRRDNAWVDQSAGRYFPNADGELYYNRFIYFGERGTYFMGEDGTKRTGTVRFQNKLYQLNNVTGKLEQEYKPGYHMINGKRYYVDEQGNMKEAKGTAGWVIKDGKNYYVKADGTVYRNRQISFGDTYYYMDENGASTDGIHEVDGRYYFYDPANNNVRRHTKGILSWKGNRYYIGTRGYIVTNQPVQVGDGLMEADDTGKLVPTNRLLVIDLSTHQKPKNFDFDAFSRGISGVILRAGYTGHGTGDYYEKDEEFERFYKEFNARGIPIGAYWYSCANEVKEGVAEAKFFQKSIAGKKFALPVYWDTEDEYHQRKTDKKTLTDTALAFLEEMEKAGYYTGIYASSSWLRDKLEISRLKKYDVWVAHYGVNTPSYTGDYGMWQFTSTYEKDGFPYGVDANWMLADYPSIIRKAKKNGF